MADGSFKPLVARTFPLEQIVEAHRFLESNQQIAANAAAGQLDAKPVRVFGFDNIQEAHRVMEANKAGGKLVVVL